MRLMIVPMMWSLFETEPAIAAWLRAWFVQINVDLGMAKWSNAAVAGGFAAMDEANGLVCDELHRAERVGL